MAKQIKVIKCPNCGSVQKTEIKPEHYRCDNCQTEYFLDNDDINIHIHHQNRPTKPINVFTHNPTLKIVLASIGVIVLVTVFTLLFKRQSDNPPSQNRVSQVQNTPSSSGVNSPPTTAKITEVPKKFHTQYEYCSTIIDKDKAYILTLEDHSYAYNDHHFFFTIYDLTSNKSIKEYPIDKLSTDKFGQVKWSYLDFSNDKTYFVANNNTIFLLDKINAKLDNITPSLLHNHPDYQTGLASVTISQTTSGNAFHILTNDGKKIYYYPLIDEVYVDNYDFQMLKNRPKRAPDDTREHTTYDFANRYGEDNKLIKFTYVSYDGKPHLSIRSANVGDEKLTEYGKHTDSNTAYDIVIDSAYRHNKLVTVMNHKNLTPNRLYFDPSILYSDNHILIIKTKANAAPGANYNYQQIDIEHGKVIWTLSDELFTIKEITPYGENFIAKQDCNQYAIISANGSLIKRITLKD